MLNCDCYMAILETICMHIFNNISCIIPNPVSTGFGIKWPTKIDMPWS